MYSNGDADAPLATIVSQLPEGQEHLPIAWLRQSVYTVTSWLEMVESPSVSPSMISDFRAAMLISTSEISATA